MNFYPQKSAAAPLRRMYAVLADQYGPQGWWPAETPFEVVVGAYLTQNTSWRAVERSIANLRTHGILNLKGLRAIPEIELVEFIKPSGFMQRKASSIKAFIHFLDREYNGSLTRLSLQHAMKTRQQLLALPGVGPETADAIMLYALGQPVIVVDEYLRRIVSRHKLIRGKAGYVEIQELALSAFVDDDLASRTQHYNEFHALVVEVGKQHCRRQPQCDGCPLSNSIFNPPQLAAPARRRRKVAARK